MSKEKCNQIIEELINEKNLMPFESSEIEKLFVDHPECKHAIEDFISTWNNLGGLDTPEPSSRMDDRFYESLEKFEQRKLPEEDFSAKLVSLYRKNRKTLYTLSIAASLFLAGILVGPFLQSNSADKNLDQTENGNENLYQLAGYGEDKLSVDRLDDVNKIKELPQINKKIIEALNQALLKDPNINVRLSAIEAMLHFADHPQVRQNLIEAIPFQTSPIVQLTLAEVMIELQETKSKEAWNKLLKEGHVEDDVKKQLKETLEIII